MQLSVIIRVRNFREEALISRVSLLIEFLFILG